MSGNLGPVVGPTWRGMSQAAFLSWLEDPPSFAYWRTFYGTKPTVRVPAAREAQAAIERIDAALAPLPLPTRK